VESPPAYRWKGLNLYRVSIELKNETDARTAITPYLFALQPGR
jgi:hypothetical protein